MMSFDMSRKMPPDRSGNQRYIICACKFSDEWIPLFFRRKSDVYPKMERFIKRINNRIAPYSIAKAYTDCDSVLTSKEMYSIMDRFGIELFFAPSNTQARNPAKNVMRRHQKAMQATMFRCNGPSGVWSYAASHVCFVHNHTKKPGTDKKPIEISQGFASTFPINGIFGNRCMAKQYINGKLEKKASPHIFFGFDPRCRASIARMIRGKDTVSRDRYVHVIKHEITEMPCMDVP